MVYPAVEQKDLFQNMFTMETLLIRLMKKDWLDTMRIPYLADLNKQISESKIKEIIEANELFLMKK